MTQLMLFDAPVPTSLPAAAGDSANRPAPRLAASQHANHSSYKAPAADEPQRMGNLAHLVIARYDMVVRRREAQRQAAQRRLEMARTQNQTA
ncbi:MAG: hypothetical protein R3C05_07055 [Pirellulaceae bacterium]